MRHRAEHRDDGSYGVRAALARLPADGVAIDLGSGTGRIARLLVERGHTVYGCELDADRAAQAAASGATIAAADVNTWSPPVTPARVVTCIELIEHLDHNAQLALLQKIHGWLEPGGHLVLSTPQRHSPVAWVERVAARVRGRRYDWWDPAHISILRRREVESLVRAAGFTVEDRVGVHLVAETLRLRPLQFSAHRGWLGRFGFDLIYVLRK